MRAGRILVISDNPSLNNYLKEELSSKEGYEITITYDSWQAFEVLKNGLFDLIIIKVSSNETELANLTREFKKRDLDCIIVVIGERVNADIMQEVSRLGIYEFLSMPLSAERLQFVVKKAVALHSVLVGHRKFISSLTERSVALQKQNILLAKRIEESTKNLTRLYENLRSTYMRTVKALAQAIEAKDHYTHSHSEKVSRYATHIARQMRLPSKQVELIHQACELHDLGKIGIHDSILTKEEPLTPGEWEQIKQHAVKGAQILEPLTFLGEVVELIRQHHEHYDGTGYPKGLKGEQILLGARIIHVADAYEAMTASRSYRKTPLSKGEAVAEIKKHSGRQFDPKVVEAFLKVVDEF
jgi:putative nucleotidyltransferase with HDIG domain